MAGFMPLRGGAIYRLGIFPMNAAGHAAWALGVGRRALDEINAMACKAVDFAHEAAGTASITHGSVLQRCFRDMHTGTQHLFIGEDTYLQCAEVFLGLRDESPAL